MTICGITGVRFLNMCRAHGITLWNWEWKENQGSFCVGEQEIPQILDLLQKAGLEINERRSKGILPLMRRFWKRSFLLGGTAGGFLLLYLLSTILWSVEINGNSQISTAQVLHYLESELSIRPGIRKSKLSCDVITAGVRTAFPEITWVSARISGTRLLIAIQENRIRSITGIKEENENLVADADGTVVSMFVRQGTAEVIPGDVCQKGQILVSGKVPVMDDNKEVKSIKSTTADADVFLKTDLFYYQELPLRYARDIDTGQFSRGFFFQFGTYRFEFFSKERKSKGTRESSNTKQMHVTENFLLPVFYGTTIQRNCQIQHLRYSDDRIKKEAYGNLISFLKKLMEKGVQIYENNVKISLYDDKCVASGKIQVIKKVGTQSS